MVADTVHAYNHVRGIYYPIAIGVFAVILLTVAVMLVKGARRRRPDQRSEAMRLELLYAGLLAGVVVFLLAVTFKTETPIDRVAAHPALSIRVTAAQWSWRFVYPNGKTVAAVSTWHPPVALVPTGQDVEFSANSRDVIHGFYVPRLRFQRQLLPGYVTRFDLRFAASGLYEGACGVYCGDQHTEMHFLLRAVSPAEFQRWLSSGPGEAAGGPS